MIRKFKALGLAGVAVLAMSAVVASSASAATFNSQANKTILTGSNTGEGNVIFKTGETQVSCTTAVLTGTATGEGGGGTTTTVSVRPTYGGCTLLGEPAAVDTTGCTYKFESHTSGGHLPTYIDCTGGSKITVTTGACNLSFGSQKTTGGTKATNIGSGSTASVTIHATAEEEFTKSGPLCFLVAGNKGSYLGFFLLFGFLEGSISKSLHEDGYVVSEGAQVGISWS